MNFTNKIGTSTLRAQVEIEKATSKRITLREVTNSEKGHPYNTWTVEGGGGST